MILRNYLETVPDDRIIYICPKAGAIAAGTKNEIIDNSGEIDMKAIDQLDFAYTAAKVKVDEAEESKKPAKIKRAKERLERLKTALTKYTPILDRQVIDTYERTTEDATNIYIEGEEVGKIWSIKEGTEEWKTIELNYNLDGLVSAIVREVADEYAVSLRNEIDALKDALKVLDRAMIRSGKMEKYFRESDYVSYMTHDPEYLIDFSRKMIADEVHKLLNGEKEDGR